MSCLPLKQLSKSQRSIVQLQIEPDAKIVQSNFRSQASLKARHVMRAFARQAEGIEQLVIDGLDDLSQMGQPTTQSFGPTLLAPLMRRGDQIYLILLLPLLSGAFPCKPFISKIRSLSGQTDTQQVRRRVMAGGKQGRGQLLIVGTRTSKAEPGNHSLSP